MASPTATPPPLPQEEEAPSFWEFPGDVQLAILSFLSPADISAFACTSHRSASLSSSPDLWLAMCFRRWGSRTLISRWIPSTSATGGGGAAHLRRLYKTLDQWERLIGFWRGIEYGAPSPATASASPPLLFVEWSPSSINASRVSPSVEDAPSYSILKNPFLWLGLSKSGEPITVRFDAAVDDFIPVSVSFLGPNHFVVEEASPISYLEDRWEDVESLETGAEGTSPPDQMTADMYRYFANRTIPGGDKGPRRMRRKKGKERYGRKRWEEHFVKINNYNPTPARPLQGLWKGISEHTRLNFYLVAYDDIGGITCRLIGEDTEPLSGYSLVFWTSNAKFLESPFPAEERAIYDSRVHIRPATSNRSSLEDEVVSRLLRINSSYDLVIPNLPGSSGDPRNVEGRIWVYKNGTFGFGFLRNNFIVDLNYMTLNGRLVDAVDYSSSGPSL